MVRYPVQGAAREILNDTGLSMNEYILRWVVEHKPEQWVNGASLRLDFIDKTGYDVSKAQLGQALHVVINSRKFDFDGTWLVERGTPAMYKWVPNTAQLVTVTTPAPPAVRRLLDARQAPPAPVLKAWERKHDIRVLDTRPDGSKLLTIDHDYYIARKIDT